MEKLIQDSILTDKTVIIPTLGTLTLTNSDTLEIMFLSYLKFDDKKLTTDYAKINNCSYTEAKDAVYAWVEKLINNVNSGQSQSILNLGFFQLNSEKEIDFVSGKQTTAENDVSNDRMETLILETPKLEIPNPKHLSESIKANHETEEHVHQKATEGEIEEETVSVAEKIEEETVIIEKPVEEEIVNFNSIEDFESPSSSNSSSKIASEEPTTQKKRSKIPVVIFSLIGLFIISSIIFYLVSDKFKIESNNVSTEDEKPRDAYNSEKTKSIETPVQIEESNSTETIIEEEIDQKNSIEAINNSHINSGVQYYVIVGSFEEQENANKLLSNLKSKQYNSEIIESGPFKMVAITYFNTLEEAQSKVNEIGGAWIFKK